ncbi:MAG TPA: RHS repeat-associated core domain-containing protein [Cellvibrio sp.]|nr:RHS repeat-associated core domain-containing protein [Cellvibrio sp.]
MFVFLTRLLSVVGLFLLAFPALAAEIKQDNYDIYIGDVNGDGGSDYYFYQKPFFLILHGDIATPIKVKPQDSFVVYRNGGDYASPVLLILSDQQLADKINSGALRLATNSSDFVIWSSADGGNKHIFIRGADISAPSLFLTSSSNSSLPVYAQTYPVANYPEVSNRNIQLRVEDINRDGLADVVLGSYSSEFGEMAYLANGNGVPTTQFEVIAGSVRPNVPLDLNDGVSYHVGTIGGEFRVDESGSANYTIPIQLPQGTAGVTPEVSLNYASGSGVGVLGKGWSLTAFSSISRCRQTLVQDMAMKPITWTSEDRFCLDGQRLILTSGDQGANNSKYKTELNNFAEIVAVGDVYNGTGYFKVTAKDGSETFYGLTNKSKFYNSTAGVGTTLTWAQSRFQDNVGNGIDYDYEGDSTTGQRLKNIYYSYPEVNKNPSAIPVANTYKTVITFNYEGPFNVSSAYVAGYEFKQTQRLNQILVQDNGNEVRRYNLGYIDTATTKTQYGNNISRLQKITECNGAGDCFKPTTFSWGGGSTLNFSNQIHTVNFTTTNAQRQLLSHFFADLTGDGKQDLVYLTFESGSTESAQLILNVKYTGLGSSSIYFSNVDTRYFRISTLDYNADGRQDVAVYNGGKWNVYLSTPRPLGEWQILDDNLTKIDIGVAGINTNFVDVDGDGLADAADGNGYKLLVRNSQPNTSANAYSFGAVRNFNWGLKENYPGLIGPLNRNLTCNEPSYEKKLAPTKVADFNGDGMVDFIGNYFKYGTCSAPSAPQPIYVPVNNYYALIRAGDTLTNYGNIRLPDADITPVDINGDGLSDITYRSINNIYYMINNGAGFNAANLWVTVPSNAAPQYLDVNNDGYIDVIWSDQNTKKLMGRLWGDPADIVVSISVVVNQNESNLLQDINGDGIVDYSKVTATGLSASSGNYPYTGNAHHTNIYSIDNGLGNITTISYGTLASSGHYKTTDVNLKTTTTVHANPCYPSSSSQCAPTYSTVVHNSNDFYAQLNGGWVLPAGNVTLESNNQTKGKPVLEVNGSTSIVTSVESSVPKAGETPNNVDTSATSKINYYYAEAKLQASGRGFLGFNTLKTVDAQTGITTVTTYRQDFPFIGNPLATVVYKSDTKDAIILSKSINTWDFVSTTSGSAKYFQTKLKKAEEFSYDYANGTELQSVTTENEFDDYGNLTSSKVTTSGKKADSTVATTLTKQTTNSYGTSVKEKQFGRLTSSTVTSKRDAETEVSRTSLFTYYGANDPKGAEYLLQTETVSAGSLAASTTTYEYDVFGNKNKITTSASDTTQTRNVNHIFENGRYLQSTTNDLNQTSTINTRDAYGNVKEATDINSMQSKVFYDAMGSEYLRKDPSGAWSRVETSFCSSSIACPTGAKYRAYKRVAGGSKSYEYFDVLGRVIRSSKVGFDGTLIHVDTEYDNLNRIKRQSVPFSGATADYWTENTYDHLGRIVKVKAPDLSESTIVYAGNQTTLTNSLSQERVEYRDGLGQLGKVKDHLGGIVEYEYDLFGNLTKTKTTADGTSVTVQICYDALGRKVAMHDPDKGGFVGNASSTCDQVIGATPKKGGWWYYRYNGFGELIEQTDPKGQMVKNYYDQLGRMIGRTDYLASNAIEGFSQWFYEGGLGSHQPSIDGRAVKGRLTATLINSATNLTNTAVETHIQDQTASCSETDASCHKTLLDFDTVSGLPTQSTVFYPGSNKGYQSNTRYDSLGRVSMQFDALDGVVTDLTGKKLESGTQTHYNNYGYAYKTTDVATGRTFQLIQEANVLGQVTKELRGNGLSTVNNYDIRTGLLTNQKTLNALNLTNVQNNNYGWDAVGNLKYRQNLSGKPGTPIANNSTTNSYNQAESFCYDGLNRLIKTNAGETSTSACANLSTDNQDIKYNGHGNITYKKDVGSYAYTAAGPHAVTTAGSNSYTYDVNGNNISGAGRTLQYTTYDMVKSISKAGKTTQFKYGIDRSRWQRIDATATTTYMGNVERIQTSSTTVEWKRNVAGVVMTYRTDNNNNLQVSDKRYVYTDHLGSVDLITDANGEVQGQFSKVSHAMSFDAWGARRNIAQWSSTDFSLALFSITISGFVEPITRRGFTGHEMVDDMGIIHMNGRIYDPKLGRFLQADPFIQSATNTQSFNRYSYVLNNPLNATDPSGFFFNKIKKELKRAWDDVRPFVGVAVGIGLVAFAPWATSSILGAMGAGAISGAAGAIATGGNVVKSAFTSALSSAAFFSVGQYFKNLSKLNLDKLSKGGIGALHSFGGNLLTSGQIAGQIFAHATVGGVMSTLQGGKFGHGFLSAGFTKSITGSGLTEFGNSSGAIVGETIAAATVGGTVSEMTGGKFASGAQTAAFAYLFNQTATDLARYKQDLLAQKNAFDAQPMRTTIEAAKYSAVVEFQGGAYKFSGSWNMIDGYVEQVGFATGSGWNFNFGVDYKINQWDSEYLIIDKTSTLSFSATAPYGGFIGGGAEFSDGKGSNVLSIRFIPSKPSVGTSYMVKTRGKSN